MKSYIPKSKFDHKAVERLQACEFESVKTDVPALLEWLQDMNWPVARGVALYLRPHMNEMEEEILAVLNGDDGMWKYWITCSLVGASTQLPGYKIIQAIKRIAEHPTPGERLDAVDEVARDVIANQGW